MRLGPRTQHTERPRYTRWAKKGIALLRHRRWAKVGAALVLLFFFSNCRFSAKIPSTKLPQGANSPTNSSTTASLSISDAPSHGYGSVTLGNTSDKIFTVSNSGDGSATSLSGASFGTAHFTFTGGTYPGTGGTCAGTLASGGSCTIIVRFAPGSSGAKSDTITLSFHDGTTSTTTTRGVTGTGLTIAALSISDGPTYDFGSVSTSGTSNQTFTVTNSGETTATAVSGAAFSSSDFLFVGGAYPGGGTWF